MIQNLHLISCAAMTGIIWMVQLLAYPGFLSIEEKQFKKYHANHMQRISWIVLPFMGLELITGILLLLKYPTWIWIANLISILVLWIVTLSVSVPLHQKLQERGSHTPTIKKLIHTNWLRTVLWSLRIVLLVQIDS
jgi:hypothetical protein